MSRKPILCLDFDGVLHSYTSGWKGTDVIPDPPVPGAFNFLFEAIAHFRVAVFSSRSGQQGGKTAMQNYLRHHAHQFWEFDQRATYKEAAKMAGRLLDELEFPDEKPPAMVSIDDRALTFTGVWPSIEKLQSFKPWNKGGVAPSALLVAAIDAARADEREVWALAAQDIADSNHSYEAAKQFSRFARALRAGGEHD